MRYRTLNGGFLRSQHYSSIVELLVNFLSDALGQYTGQLRLVGHSLGSQVVLGAAKCLAERVECGHLQESLLPHRLALMDPYFSLRIPVINPQSYLPSGSVSTAKLGVEIARYLIARGVVLEHLKTSPLTQLFGLCDPNDELGQLCACVERLPEWISPTDWQGLHMAAPNLYFASLGFPPPPCSVRDVATTSYELRCPSASSSDDDIRTCMGLSPQWKFVQTGGKNSFDISDDRFELIRR
mmetsp:Transcript_26757/g.50607  ORF Transcript_26757/g.50607 Transcript_26757/m.50607 type:complete len:240 (-) Transcript_26757:1422-2141(-)